MENLIIAKRQSRWMAGIVAIWGSLLAIGGPMMLAEHYAQNGASGDASSHYAAEQTRRNAGTESGNAAATVLVRHSVENS